MKISKPLYRTVIITVELQEFSEVLGRMALEAKYVSMEPSSDSTLML
jgi:hypothetical protein